MNARLIAAALFISIVTKNLWEITCRNLYFLGDGIAWLLFSVVIYRLAMADYWLNRLALFTIGLCVADLLDTLFFDPYITGWNEWVAAGVIFILVFKKRKKAWQIQQKNRANLL